MCGALLHTQPDRIPAAQQVGSLRLCRQVHHGALLLAFARCCSASHFSSVQRRPAMRFAPTACSPSSSARQTRRCVSTSCSRPRESPAGVDTACKPQVGGKRQKKRRRCGSSPAAPQLISQVASRWWSCWITPPPSTSTTARGAATGPPSALLMAQQHLKARLRHWQQTLRVRATSRAQTRTSSTPAARLQLRLRAASAGGEPNPRRNRRSWTRATQATRATAWRSSGAHARACFEHTTPPWPPSSASQAHAVRVWRVPV